MSVEKKESNEAVGSKIKINELTDVTGGHVPHKYHRYMCDSGTCNKLGAHNEQCECGGKFTISIDY